MFYSHYDSPVGQLLMIGDGENILRIDFATTCQPVTLENSCEFNPTTFRTLTNELDAYFKGRLQKFSVAVKPNGSAFQKKVWDALQRIEYGQTCTYADIARSIGKPTASRAVGSANGRNPVSIIIPCHRVIGANGTLTGYAGGVNTKQWLLSHEAGEQPLFPFDEW